LVLVEVANLLRRRDVAFAIWILFSWLMERNDCFSMVSCWITKYVEWKHVAEYLSGW
jgi:hypothetical protein